MDALDQDDLEELEQDPDDTSGRCIVILL